MKAIILITLLCGILNAEWTFTTKELRAITKEQKEVLKMAMLVGKENGLGLTLAKIAIVETRLGKIRTSDRRWCGATQVSTKYAKVPCKVLEKNHYVAMKTAAKNFKGWLKKYDNNMKKAYSGYNSGGLKNNKITREYHKRLKIVDEVLRKEFG